MRLDGLRRSRNIEDRRAGGGGDGGFTGGLGSGGIRPVRGGGGLGMIIILILLVVFGGGGGLTTLLSGGDAGPATSPGGFQAPAEGVDPQAARTTGEAATADRVAAILGTTEDFWSGVFAQAGQTYEPATLVLFNRATASPCGQASGATGPFYCPADKKVYLDLSFFDEMERSLGARGDFAQAYVIAHEIAHHVQDVTGILPQAHQAMRRRGEDKGADSVAVRLELQADCYAGLWAAKAPGVMERLEPGDIEEALGAAAAVGDDRLQKRAQGYAVPDSFTHGTSEQRARWFNVGLRADSLSACDTFRAREL
jgi:predicted metalloprotease